MLVFVQNKHGKPLMPCHPAKARLLLKEGKAKVVKRTPFTIQLLYGSSGYKQPITLGVDSGYSTIGLSAVTKEKELFSAEVKLRNDIVKLNSERRAYRRARRHRKTWHRKPRFLNRKKPKRWLPPSIQHKLDSHLRIINKVKEILPISKIVVEVAAFDIQKIKNPDISGLDYQNGEQKGFWNVREYVLYRDGHTCQCCKGKSRDSVLQVHHLISRQIGGDRPDNLITLCSTCHDKVSRGVLKLDVKPSKGFKAETFMSTVRWKLIENLKKEGNVVSPVAKRRGEVVLPVAKRRGEAVVHTYGYITKQRRIALSLPKSHTNDAFVIGGGGKKHRRADVYYFILQVRKSNRKLFKGQRSHIRNSAERFIFGFQRFDKVLFSGVECFIFGRRSTGYFDLRKLDGSKIHASAKAKELTRLESAKSFLIERRTAFLPS